MEHYKVTFDIFSDLCYRLLHKIREGGKEYHAILCPLRGGFYLSYFMNNKLEIPLSYIEISSYAGKQQTRFQIGIKPDIVEGKILLCDDIYDSGNTAKKIHSMYPNVNFDTACLITKIPEADIYYGQIVPKETWVDFFWETL